MYNDSEFFDPEIVSFIFNALINVSYDTTYYYTINT